MQNAHQYTLISHDVQFFLAPRGAQSLGLPLKILSP
jgi:hypothetical protein